MALETDFSRRSARKSRIPNSMRVFLTLKAIETYFTANKGERERVCSIFYYRVMCICKYEKMPRMSKCCIVL